MTAAEPVRWTLPALAGAVFAIDPGGLQGLVLRAPAGPVRDRWLRQLQALLPADTPWRRLPLHTGDDRLFGGLDLTATLASGRPVLECGLLAETAGGILLLAMAERMEPAVAVRLAATLDTGQVALERSGLSRRMPARLGMVALDEGLDAGESIPEALADRFAIHLSLEGLAWQDTATAVWTPEAIATARSRLPAIRIREECIQVLCLTAAQFGLESLRIPVAAVRVARLVAALAGERDVTEDHLGMAAQLVYAGRATRLPAAETEGTSEAEMPPDSGQSQHAPDDDEQEAQSADAQSLQDQVLDATRAVIPPGLLEQLRYASLRRSATRASSKSATRRRPAKRGRRTGTCPGKPRANSQLNLVETLRAAAPWQSLRQRAAEEAGPRCQQGAGTTRGVTTPTGPVPVAVSAPAIRLRQNDFRLHRYQQRTATTSVFVVDASGSAALQRLAEAKGAVELMLAESYQRRDQVALVAFRGQQAELLLPATRSLVRAKRALAGLPGGGGTPLAAGLQLAHEIALGIRRKGEMPVIILLTDGRANVTLDGRGDRQRAQAEALEMARAVRAEELTALLVDTSVRPRPPARQLAEDMAAHYLPLPQADAMALSRAAQSLSGGSNIREAV